MFLYVAIQVLLRGDGVAGAVHAGCTLFEMSVEKAARGKDRGHVSVAHVRLERIRKREIVELDGHFVGEHGRVIILAASPDAPVTTLGSFVNNSVCSRYGLGSFVNDFVCSRYDPGVIRE